MKNKQGNLRIQKGIQRFLDLLICMMGLIFLSPILIIIAVAEKLDSSWGLSLHIVGLAKMGDQSMYPSLTRSPVDLTNLITLWNFKWEKWMGEK